MPRPAQGRGLPAAMQPPTPVRLPPALETAVQRVRMAARSAAERTIDSLGLAALSSTNVFQRDGLLGAQYDLNRKLAIFALTFNETLDGSVEKEVAPPSGHGALPDASTVTNWDALSLVDDHEVEVSIGADRFALEIAHACEWELRDLEGYIASLLGRAPGEPVRNPLRAQLVGQALIRAVEAVSDRAETRKVLGTEIGRSLAQAMRQTYADITADLRDSGIRPFGLTVLQTPRPGNDRGGARRGADANGGFGDGADPAGRQPAAADSRSGFGGGLANSHRLRDAAGGAASSGWGTSGGFGCAGTSRHDGGSVPGGLDARTMGEVDPGMMSLIRRLNRGAGGAPAAGDAASDPAGAQSWGADFGAAAQPAPNLIYAHREELHRNARSALDRMVIDVVATLFDQILADAKVPPQAARLIARLQWPVLRAALGDPTFFSARRHPVRRLVNRIASLGAAMDELAEAERQALLERMTALVQEIVDGDFDHIEVYQRTLAALETFVAEQSLERLRAHGDADALLARKEQQLRVEQRFARDLGIALAELPIPDYLRDFLSQVWSRVIAAAESDHGRDSAQAQRARDAGRALVLSVQPKGAPAQRKTFLQQLPQLMKDLNCGMDRVAWPDEQRREFFAALLPAHAESLKGQPISTLELNLLARKVDTALGTPLPSGAQLAPAPPDPQAQVSFTPAEAQAVGLVDEASVDWRAAVDADQQAEPEVTAADLRIDGIPQPEAPEPSGGKSLADHVQVGFAYRMHLGSGWRKVRLAHVSAQRSFFVFTHGAKQRETVSMTYRMLVRMCDSGRLCAYENAFLLERATARTRQQLAALRAGEPAPARPARRTAAAHNDATPAQAALRAAAAFQGPSAARSPA